MKFRLKWLMASVAVVALLCWIAIENCRFGYSEYVNVTWCGSDDAWVAWVTFRKSAQVLFQDDGQGYRLTMIAFKNLSPVPPVRLP